MPFDCAPVIDEPKQAAAIAVQVLGTNIVSRSAGAIRPRSILRWYMSGRAEGVDAAVAILARARELISDERHWCKRAFAFTWLGIPVPVGSRYARRFCALGAIKRAGRELGLTTNEASRALEWQTVRLVIDWNDDKARTHAEVVAGFDAAIDALAVMTPAA